LKAKKTLTDGEVSLYSNVYLAGLWNRGMMAEDEEHDSKG
jgi:hypothetical protein